MDHSSVSGSQCQNVFETIRLPALLCVTVCTMRTCFELYITCREVTIQIILLHSAAMALECLDADFHITDGLISDRVQHLLEGWDSTFSEIGTRVRSSSMLYISLDKPPHSCTISS